MSIPPMEYFVSSEAQKKLADKERGLRRTKSAVLLLSLCLLVGAAILIITASASAEWGGERENWIGAAVSAVIVALVLIGIAFDRRSQLQCLPKDPVNFAGHYGIKGVFRSDDVAPSQLTFPPVYTSRTFDAAKLNQAIIELLKTLHGLMELRRFCVATRHAPVLAAALTDNYLAYFLLANHYLRQLSTPLTLLWQSEELEDSEVDADELKELMLVRTHQLEATQAQLAGLARQILAFTSEQLPLVSKATRQKTVEFGESDENYRAAMTKMKMDQLRGQ